MPYDVKILTVPIREDLALNLFGDYDRLALYCFRDQKTQNIYKEWRLLSSPRASREEFHKKLAADQVYGALENLFIQSASRHDGDPTDVLPTLETCAPLPIG